MTRRSDADQTPIKRAGDGSSGAQKRAHVPLPDAVGAKKKCSSAPGRSADKGGADKKCKYCEYQPSDSSQLLSVIDLPSSLTTLSAHSQSLHLALQSRPCFGITEALTCNCSTPDPPLARHCRYKRLNPPLAASPRRAASVLRLAATASNLLKRRTDSSICD